MSLIAGLDKYCPLFIPYNAKIADITEADTLKHFLVLANAGGTGAIAGETRKIIAVNLFAQRMTGTGAFYTYPNEGAKAMWIDGVYGRGFCVIADGTQRLQYALSVANDDWDIYCMGYVVES